MLTRWGGDMPEIVTDLAAGDQVVVVDTNNPAELPAQINETEILEIIDHHMLVGGLKTRTPINITIRPLACTATIMHDLIGDDLAGRAVGEGRDADLHSVGHAGVPQPDADAP